MSVTDGAEVAVPHLVNAYFAGFDDRRHDESWLESIFSDDVIVRFPVGQARGLPRLAEITREAVELWSATLHQTTNHHVDPTSDGARFSAALTATHVHHPDESGTHLRIGARVTGVASRRPDEWRIDELAIDLVWSEGDGPGHPQAPAA